MLSTDEGAVLDVGYARLRLARSQVRLHTHAYKDGFIFVAPVTVGVGAGGVLLMLRRTMHTFCNPTAIEAVALEFFAPARLERWFAGLAERPQPTSANPPAMAAATLAGSGECDQT